MAQRDMALAFQCLPTDYLQDNSASRCLPKVRHRFHTHHLQLLHHELMIRR
jgi:hypothetical protein